MPYRERSNFMSELIHRVEVFLSHGTDLSTFQTLLQDCIAAHTIEALSCVQRLYSDDYEGFTYKWELKNPAGAALLCWGEAGVDALTESATGKASFKNIGICLQVLASAAAGQAPVMAALEMDSNLFQTINNALKGALVCYCRKKLMEFVINLPEDDVHLYVGNALTRVSIFPPLAGRAPVTELSRALAFRMISAGEPVLRQFEELIENRPDHEPAFQNILTAHPQLIDPMAFQVWPKPDLRGAKEPDFVVRRSDDSYLIVEIESPRKPLVTDSCQMSAFVTEAEKQAADYRSFLVRRFEDAKRHFPRFDEPDCLVVIGLEGLLREEQKAALRDANNNRHRLRIVGFDWLVKRSRAVIANLIESSIEVSKLRMI